MPTLLLWGADDPFAPLASAERFQREIPGSELVVLEGTGHFVVDDAPERYAEALVGFLRRAARARHAELVVALGALVDGAGRVDVHGQHLPFLHGGPWTSTSARSPGASSGAGAGVSVMPSTETTTSNGPASERPRLTTGTT